MALAEFHALFEERLHDFDECQTLDYPTPGQLYRAYLTKLSGNVRDKIIGKDWKLDGRDKPARAPATYKELFKAAGLYNEERADIVATSRAREDMICMVDPSGKLGLPKAADGAKGGRSSITCK